MMKGPAGMKWFVGLIVATSLSLPSLVAAQSDDEKELLHFKLTMPLVEKCAAVNERAAAMAEANPQMGRDFEQRHSRADDSIAGTVRNFERSPQLTSIIKSQGLSVREYVLTTFALLQAGMYSEMKKSMPTLKPPAYMNMANVGFVEAHRAELDKMQSRMDPSTKRRGNKSKNVEKDDPDQ